MKGSKSISALQSHSKRIGALGEQVAAEYLEKQGYLILARNYARKYAEIDLIAKETAKRKGFDGVARETIHFVEVKTVVIIPYEQV